MKLRYSQDIARGKQYASDPLLATVALARKLETSICVHVTDSLLCADALIRYFEEGDIYVHCFPGIGNSILNDQGQVY
ncbi:hydrolase, partial [Klebsiella quasipneumoniae]|nr:hydrolase [Klebsiella quasipneumoniae]